MLILQQRIPENVDFTSENTENTDDFTIENTENNVDSATENTVIVQI